MPLETSRLREAITADFELLRARLQELVLCESPTEDAAAVNRAMNLVSGWAEEAGARVVRHAGDEYGDAVELRFGDGAVGRRPPHMLLGHLDTVWPVGTLQVMPWRETADAEGRPRLWGPGVLDMKAGVVMALAALEAVQRCGGLPGPVVLLLNPDEETGSRFSRPHTERIARECEAVFVLEPAQGLPGTRDNAAFAATTVADALALIATIGALAEELDHHPDVDWRYRQVFVRSTTHSAGGRLTELDVTLAGRISAAAARLGVTAELAQ